MMKHEATTPAFRDASLEAEFSASGYVVLQSAVPSGALEHLERTFDQGVSQDNFLPLPEGFDVAWQFDSTGAEETRRLHVDTFGMDSHATFLLPDESLKRRTWHDLCDTMAPHLSAILSGYRCVPSTSAFLVKPPRGGHIRIHRNWTMLTSPHGRTVTAWVPFHDVDANRGCMRVVPGSHGTSHEISTFGTRGSFAGAEHVVEEFLVDVPMKRGDILILDDRLIHHSYVNASEERRLAAVINCHPERERSVFFQKHPDFEDVYAVIDLTEDFFASLATPGESRAPNVPIGWVRHMGERWTEAQTRTILTDSAAVRSSLAASPGWTIHSDLPGALGA